MLSLIAWVGGAAFAASLAYFVYFFAVTLSSSSGDTGTAIRHAAVNVGLFSVFALHHSLLARTRAKRWIAQVVPATAERTLYVWAASALLVALCTLWQSVPGTAYEALGGWRLPLYFVQAMGAAITVRAAGVIDPLELAGIRQATARHASASLDLKVVGPFRLVRHPIYLGWMLMVFGAPSMTSNRLLFAVISSAYLILAIPWEEKSLVAAHGDQYRAYQRTVRWRLVPGIW